jgi:hypothetical protein
MKKLLLILLVLISLSCNNSTKTYTLTSNLEFTRTNGTKVIVPVNIQYEGEKPLLYKNIKDECWYIKYNDKVEKLICDAITFEIVD